MNEKINTLEAMQNRKVEIWTPDELNLKKKTRKEMMNNISNIEKLYAALSVSSQEKYGKVLESVQGNMDFYLKGGLGVPFSWHEVLKTPSLTDQ